MRFGYLKWMGRVWTESAAVTGDTSTQSGLESSLWQQLSCLSSPQRWGQRGCGGDREGDRMLNGIPLQPAMRRRPRALPPRLRQCQRVQRRYDPVPAKASSGTLPRVNRPGAIAVSVLLLGGSLLHAPKFTVPQHCVQDHQQFAHAGHQRHFFWFPALDQAVVEGLDDRVVARGHKGRHVKRRSDP